MGSRRVAGLSLIASMTIAPCAGRELAKAPAAEVSQPCPEYGSGFVRAPGSPTCLRLSGRVRVGAELRTGRDAPVAPTVSGRFAIDTRTESDLGPIRTFVRIGDGRR